MGRGFLRGRRLFCLKGDNMKLKKENLIQNRYTENSKFLKYANLIVFLVGGTSLIFILSIENPNVPVLTAALSVLMMLFTKKFMEGGSYKSLVNAGTALFLSSVVAFVLLVSLHFPVVPILLMGISFVFNIFLKFVKKKTKRVGL